MRQASSPRTAPADELLGYGCAVGCYVFWGFLPIYFYFLKHVPADQIVAHRIVWSVVLVAAVLAVRRRLGEVVAVFADRGLLLRLTLSACILAVNWLLFVWAVEHGRVLEVSFGYFINPLVSVALGTVLLGETLNRVQRVAVGIALVAIAIQAWSLGGLPWVSLTLAFSFGFYGFLRKKAQVGAAPGLLVEALVLAPLALAYLGWRMGEGTLVFAQDTETILLLIGTGVATGGPLILFAAAVRRLPLSTMGLLQYLAPSLQFLVATLLFSEPLQTLRLVGFVMIWISLAVFTRDALARRAARPVVARRPPP